MHKTRSLSPRDAAMILLLALFLTSCASTSGASSLVTDEGSLANHVDEVVTLQGVLFVGTKGARLLGVSVGSFELKSMRGCRVEATGVLRYHTDPRPVASQSGSAFDANQMRAYPYYSLRHPDVPAKYADVHHARAFVR